ncbi:MAG: hypothetical protein PPFGHCPK_01100 [Spiroplasma endosymbiont of Drosophila atripex]|nr:MAG: hypothetical protein PPFGHCPK_01100 [Spiroplasma endosymbiont of Drosophila atripex]
MIKFNYAIIIDPAGFGSTGIMLINIIQNKIEQVGTFKSENDNEAKNKLKKIMNTFNDNIKNFKPFVIPENFFLSKKRYITNPLLTPLFIGQIKSLVEDYFNWRLIASQEPSCKKGYRYDCSIKLTKHEYDCWKIWQSVLDRIDDIEELSSKEKTWIKKHCRSNN